MITVDTLRAFAPKLTLADARTHADALEAARVYSTVNNLDRLAAFMGQIAIETAWFTVMEENLNYRDPKRLDDIFSAVKGVDDAKALIARGPEAIANRVYANRLGNGDEASGDGWRYRGSGYKQLTGRSNYAQIGKTIGMDLVNNPWFARAPATAARIAFAFWDATGCSAFADQCDIASVTLRVNGPAKLQLAERTAARDRAAGVWMGAGVST